MTKREDRGDGFRAVIRSRKREAESMLRHEEAQRVIAEARRLLKDIAAVVAASGTRSA